MRRESDFIGQKEMQDDALYGIHSLRAYENFPDQTPFPLEWYKSVGLVKKACYLTYQSFKQATLEKYDPQQLSFNFMNDSMLNALLEASGQIASGEHFSQFIVPAISGGAGTSINMNANEIIANVALTTLGYKPGDYHIIDPVEHANVFQSTNDVIPTSLKVAVMFLLQDLEQSINDLRSVTEHHENAHRNDLRIGYTQMQEAVPASYGSLFSTYSEALSRDWWRISRCSERIKMVNLGGGATGSGLAIPRYFIMEVVQNLQRLTNLPVTRSENMPDATSNLDPLVEVHAILKAHAVNLEKMVSDIRLLSSDITSQKIHDPDNPTFVIRNSSIVIPERQAGSSIMPGKINPVIPEFVISCAHKIYANDILITGLCGQGCLELNAYIPTIGTALLESLKLLIATDLTLKKNLCKGLIVNGSSSHEQLINSPVITTALIPFIGYNKASELARMMKTKGLSIYEANRETGMIDEEKLREILIPGNLLKTGFVIGDILQKK